MLKEYKKKLTVEDGIITVEKGTVVTKIVMCDDGSVSVSYVKCPKLAEMAKDLGIAEH